MKVIGLCGGSGSGKGSVCAIFLERGIPSIDTDAVYREMTAGDSACLRALSEEFGNTIISADGSLDRRALFTVVFSGDGAAERRCRLNEITHKYILDETRSRLYAMRKDNVKAAIVDAPLLFESGFDSECDALVCVIADRETRISRIMGRDGITYEEAVRRIDSQIADEILIKSCDYVVYNDDGISSLRSAVYQVADKILC